MNTTKIQSKGQVTIPTNVREQAGLSKGDLVEFSYERGKIIITPKIVVDRSQFPSAAGEYTPAQRRMIDSRLAKAMKSRTHGPFDTPAAAITDIQGELKKRDAKKAKRAR